MSVTLTHLRAVARQSSAWLPAAAHCLLLLSLCTLPTVRADVEAAYTAGGSWVKKGHAIRGSWEITEENGDIVLRLDEHFKTRRAPDLKLFLSPQALGDVTDANATDGAVLLSPLQAVSGAQRYILPPEIDPAAFRSLLIHCEQYSKLWGGAPL